MKYDELIRKIVEICTIMLRNERYFDKHDSTILNTVKDPKIIFIFNMMKDRVRNYKEDKIILGQYIELDLELLYKEDKTLFELFQSNIETIHKRTLKIRSY
jgi:hypothetical protein